MKRRTFLGMGAVAPWLAACASNAITEANIQSVAPQGLPAQVPAPLLRPGTQWQFTMRSGITGLVTDRATFRVASAAPDGYAIDEDWQKGPAQGRYDANLNPVRTKNTAYEPPYPRYEFPLSIGKNWSATVMRDAVPAQLQGRVREEVKGNVAGWERVTVPAGTFTALRIDLGGNWTNVDNADNFGTFTEKVWYVPEVRNMALYQRMYLFHALQIIDNSTLELNAFSLS
jgi:hypothetical protein